MASKIGMWGKWKDFEKINFHGTQNVVLACIANKVKKLIYTSTPSVVARDYDLCGEDESLSYPLKFYSMYAKSKALAEDYVLKNNGKNGLMTVSLRPHLIYGPGDNNLIPRLVEAHKNNRLRRIGEGKNIVDVIYVENAAKAHVQAFNALKSPFEVPAGQTYFLGDDEPVNLWKFVNQIMEAYSLPSVDKNISRKKALSIGKFFEKSFNLLGLTKIDPPMTQFIAMQLSQSHFFSHKNAKTDFNYSPTYSTKIGLEKLKASLTN